VTLCGYDRVARTLGRAPGRKQPGATARHACIALIWKFICEGRVDNLDWPDQKCLLTNLGATICREFVPNPPQIEAKPGGSVGAFVLDDFV
jgi:hypothetical protein